MTKEREKKLKTVLERRQPDLAIILESVDDLHNVGAILRSCDAFGVLDVHLLYSAEKMPRLRDLRSRSAASAVKWLRITKWTSATKLLAHLKKQKMSLAVTTLSGRAEDPVRVDFTKPIAIALGNEHAGISDVLAKKAKIHLTIPMRGFIQSFNVSVAAALVLYEASRQREKKGMYKKSRMTKREQTKVLKEWEG